MINQKPFFAKPKQNVFQKKQKLFPQKKNRLRPFWTPKVQSRQQQNGSFAVSSIPASEPASIFKTNPRLCGACFPQTPSSCAFFSQHHPRAPFFFAAQHHLCFFHSTHLYFFHSIIVFFTASSPGTTAIATRYCQNTSVPAVILKWVRPATRLSANRTTILPNRRLPLPLPTFFWLTSAAPFEIYKK